MEQWDAYYADGTPAGCLITRGGPREAGLFNKAVLVLVRHTDGSYLLVRRCAAKASYPLWYETSAGGAVKAGEDELTGAKRELREETGIVCEVLEEISYLRDMRGPTHAYTYLCVTDCAKDAIRLQQEETDEYKWLTEEEFIAFVNSPNFIPIQMPLLRPYFEKMGYLREK